MRAHISISFAAVLLCFATSASAQGTVSGVIDDLVTKNQEVLTGGPERDRAAAEATRDTLTRALLANFTSLPIGSSSAGFVYRLNPELGTVERASESFGTFFVERALTAGHGRASFGVSATGAGFDRLAGLDLREGIVTVANQFADEDEPYDVDTLRLRISSSVMTIFGSFGVTDRLEIGGAVPLVRITLDGDRRSRYYDESFTRVSATAVASGVADIALRAKYAFVNRSDGGVAAAVEARLPTGDDANLLGAGSLAWRFLGIASAERGRAALHGNAALVRGSIDEITFGGAATFAVHPRMTLSGELLARRLSGLGRISPVWAAHPNYVDSPDPVNTMRLLADDSAVFISTAIGGLKWNLTHALVIAGYVTRPLSDNGLTAPLSGTISLEYAVGR